MSRKQEIEKEEGRRQDFPRMFDKTGLAVFLIISIVFLIFGLVCGIVATSSTSDAETISGMFIGIPIGGLILAFIIDAVVCIVRNQIYLKTHKFTCKVCGNEINTIFWENEELCPCQACLEKDEQTKKEKEEKESMRLKAKENRGTTPIIAFKGRNGVIELYERYVRLDRGTAMGFLLQGLKGKKDIYFKSITSIQIKKPGMSVGYIQFSIPGGNESMRGVFEAGMDENTLSFIGDENYEKALKIKEYIENINFSSDKSVISDSDEIEKLHKLMKKGIINKSEFEQKKRKLLGVK